MLASLFRGLFIIAGGVGIVYYAADLVGMFGRSSRMERTFGGTRAGYMLFGFLIMIIGFLTMFGIVNLGGGIEEATQIQITN